MGVVTDFEIRELRLVIELSDQRSFTNAAEHLHMSQSAFSRAVIDVERRLGARLFNRTTRSVQPTSLGLEFVRLARLQLHKHETMIREFALFQKGERGTVRVATLPSFAAFVMPGLLSSIEDRGIEVDVIDTAGRAAADLLLAGEVDFAVTAEFEASPELTFTPLIRDRFQVMFARGHRFSGRQAVSWEEAVSEPMILTLPSSSVRALIDRNITDPRLQPTRLREAQNVGVVAGMVNAGLGVTAMPAMVVPLMMFADLETAELTDPRIDRTLGLLTVEGRSTSPAAEQFSALLVDYVTREHGASALLHSMH